MPTPLLTFFKYLFLALLYLFFLRVLRAVWTELREPKTVPADPPSPVWVPARQEPPDGPLANAATVATARPGVATAVVDRLVVEAPLSLAGRVFDLSDELTLGRAPGCAIALPDDTYVSQVHARLYRRDGEVWVEDLGSTNGSFVNDERLVSPVRLHRGDRLRVGETVLGLGG